MNVIQVGEQFPDRRYFVNEGMRVRFLQSGFELIAAARSLTRKEIIAFNSESISLHLFGQGKPTAIIALKTTAMTLDAQINGAKLSPEDRSKWLTTPANLVTLVLIEATTGTVVGLRSVGLSEPFVSALAGIVQSHETYDASDIDAKNTIALNKYSTDEIIKMASVAQKFTRI